MRSNISSTQATASLRDSRVIASNRLTMALIAPMLFHYSSTFRHIDASHILNYKIFLLTACSTVFFFTLKPKIEQKNAPDDKKNYTYSVTVTVWSGWHECCSTRGSNFHVHVFHLCRWPFARRAMRVTVSRLPQHCRTHIHCILHSVATNRK